MQKGNTDRGHGKRIWIFKIVISNLDNPGNVVYDVSDINENGNDKEEYAKSAVTERLIHRLKDHLTGSLRKVAFKPDF